MPKCETQADREERLRFESLEGFEKYLLDDYLQTLAKASGLSVGDILSILRFVGTTGLCNELKIFADGSMSYTKNIQYLGYTPLEVAHRFSCEDTAALGSADHQAGRHFHSSQIARRASRLLDTHKILSKHLSWLVS